MSPVPSQVQIDPAEGSFSAHIWLSIIIASQQSNITRPAFAHLISSLNALFHLDNLELKRVEISYLKNEIPVIVDAHHCSPSEVKLTVSKKVLECNNGNFVITDSEGHTLFKLDQRKVFLRELMVLRDDGDSPAVSIHKKKISLHDTYQVYKGESSEELFTVWDKNMRDAAELTYEIQLESESDPTFQVKGDFVRRNYEIFSKYRRLRRRSNYGVLVSPNVDQAFVAAVVTIMEAIHNENKEKHGGKHSD
ncbi:hypothetical protein AXG93_2752s1270 [Marchantia polymorpha subsp. ruderalis]|uniref:Tubby C-terminal domain-containing protein n=1 Tax=Marchantia polymorpha subsp. ruderalis TaxID=1480154 RepID=A0A176VUL6_MARPO|nr:hypothetical protein AXG93_2752s1270 [Marchantia polymorpha subsp. ruderalis]